MNRGLLTPSLTLPRLLRLSERIRHRVGHPVVDAGEHVGVGIEGYGDRRVTQEFLHELCVNAPA